MKFRKLLVSVLFLAMVLSTLGMTAFAETTLVISNADELKSFASEVNSGNSYAGSTIILGDDIDLNGEEWEPIGNKDLGYYFEGTFDGADFEISGLSITESNSREDYEALFGATKNAVIKDLTVSGDIYGANVAAIVARMDGGRIENCVSKVDITCIDTKKAGGIVCLTGATEDASIITNCINYGDVVIEGNHTNSTAGGILAYISNGKGKVTVSDCENYGDVTGGAYAGGICGYCMGGNTDKYSVFEITGCINHGTIEATAAGSIAGFVGNSNGEGTHIISNCINCSDENNGTFVAANNDGTDFNADPSNLDGMPVAEVGGAYYSKLQEAFNAASNNGTVKLVSDVVITTDDKLNWNGDTYYSIGVKGTVTLDLAGHKIVGNAGSDTNHYALLCYQAKAPNVFTITDSSAVSLASEADITGGAVINDPVLTKTGKFSNVLYNNGAVVIDGGTLYNAETKDGNLAYTIESVTVGTTALTINGGSVISEDSVAVRVLSQGSTGTQTAEINGGTIVGNVNVILKNGVKDTVDFEMTNGTVNGDLKILNYATPAEGAPLDTVAVTGGTVTGELYISDSINDTFADLTLNVEAFEMYEVDTITVDFVDVTDEDARGEKVYDINLKVADGKIINRLNSADLTFVLSQISGSNEYEIIASNDEIKINPVNNSSDRYEFHYDGKTDVETDTADIITIGQVKVTGYGKYTFAIESADTNAVHTTTLFDNIVSDFVPGGILDGKQVGTLDIGDSVTEEIFAPTQDLTIKVAFPNAIINNKLAYQAMNVLVTGEDIADISIDLGTDNTGADLTLTNKTEAAYTVEFDEANSVYTIVIENALTANTAYNVTVSGAGYRTARYTVNTQEKDKTLNFWNNVKDNAINVEEGKESSKKNVTFLAGDIVKDSIINVYDLSAVVSYFGEIDLAKDNKPEYAKYDLNRDGKIDSKDVAYVLVSWGK